MITIDWKSLNAVGQEYFDRLLMYAKAHPRSYLYTRIVSVIDLETFRDLILCPPLRLEKYPCPDGLSPDDIYSIYDLFFAASGLDNENNAVWLTSKLNIKVCPYCNRSYTFTLRGKKGIRPELDHFYPRSVDAYKHLALSFYNLIPSCPSCNHRKKTEIFDYHPYVGHLVKGGLPPQIMVETKSDVRDDDNRSILFPETAVIKMANPNRNTTVLALEELYKHHSDYAKEILDKIMAYNAASYEPLISAFQGMGRTPEEIDRLIWSNYIDDAHQTNRPLSKLTHDILKQFGII